MRSRSVLVLIMKALCARVLRKLLHASMPSLCEMLV